MDELAVSEIQQLEIQESIISRGLKTFIDVGNALAAIRDNRLYRQDFNTFEDYCRERWGITRQYVNYQIKAAGVANNLATIVTKLPATESQARPLTKLEPERQIEVWQEVVETAPNGKVTAVHVQRVVNSKMAVHYSSQTDEWETPQDLFETLDDEFSFTLDVCALDSSAKCERYFTPQDDGLLQDWHKNICWMNPPYGNEIPNWIRKAHNTGMTGGVVVCLVPARVDTAWWWDYCIRGEIRFLKGRLKFGESPNSAPFPSAVVIFRGNHPSVDWWEWK